MDNPTEVVAGDSTPAAASSEAPVAASATEAAATEVKAEPAAEKPAPIAAPEAAAAPAIPPPVSPALPRAAVLPPAPAAPPLAAVEPPAAAAPVAADAPAASREPRGGRFALLAASVAIAASLGAIGGSLAVSGFGHGTPAAVASARPDGTDEIRALKETVAQLRTHVKSLSDNLAALKVGITAVNTTANAQFAKIGEALERVERSSHEQHRAAAVAPAPAPAAPEATGSITPQPASASAEQKTAAKPPILEDWIVRRVYDGAALVEGRRYGIVDVAPGDPLPGLGRVQEIRREDGRWVVVTPKGLIVQRR